VKLCRLPLLLLAYLLSKRGDVSLQLLQRCDPLSDNGFELIHFT
jgi:hypothetical protein